MANILEGLVEGGLQVTGAQVTARDRPYKKAKTLSEAIKIMGFMDKDEHIDPELFRLFLKSGVYQTYAEEFLDPSQLDEVDITPYL